MKKIDLSNFYKETETSETRAYEHALDIEFIVHREMLRQGLSRSELANRLDMKLPALSKLLNSQPNMTLKTIAKLELALGIEISPTLVSSYSEECHYAGSSRRSENPWNAFSNDSLSEHPRFNAVKGGLAA